MTNRIVVSPDIPATHDLRGLPFDAFFGSAGEVAARSRSSDTVAVRIACIDLHVKRYHYSARQAFRGSLRNTLFGPSRVRAESDMLRRLADRLPDVAPATIAFGEERRLGFLRRAFLATATVPDARPVSPQVSGADLGRFLRRLHDAGFTHGRLYARNLLTTPGGSLHLVDLDRATLTDGPAPVTRAAADLACLLVSVEGLDEESLFAAYGRDDMRGGVAAARPAAAKGLARRTAGPPHVTE